MDTISSLREQFKSAHEWLEGTMKGVTPTQLHYLPQGKALPIGASYAHIAMAEDMLVNGLLKGGAPLFASSWAGKVGISEAPPAEMPGDWSKWARSVKVDLAAVQRYAGAVHEATDQYVASLSARALDRTVQMPIPGMDKISVGAVLGNIAIGHVNTHCGEISAIKGIQGAQGYPL